MSFDDTRGRTPSGVQAETSPDPVLSRGATATARRRQRIWGAVLVLYLVALMLNALGWERAYVYGFDPAPAIAGAIAAIGVGVAALMTAPTPTRRTLSAALAAVAAAGYAVPPAQNDAWFIVINLSFGAVLSSLVFLSWGIAFPLRGAGYAGLPLFAVVPTAIWSYFERQLQIAGSWTVVDQELQQYEPVGPFLLVIGIVLSIIAVLGAVYLALLWSSSSRRRALGSSRITSTSADVVGQVSEPSRALAGSVAVVAPKSASKTNTMAILSIIFGFFVSVLAVVFGHIALSQIRRTGEQGRGLAVAGLVLGYVGIVGGLIAILVNVYLLSTWFAV